MAAQSSPHTTDFGDTEGHTRPFVHTDTLTDEQAARIERSHSIADAAICVMCVLALAWVAIGAPA